MNYARTKRTASSLYEGRREKKHEVIPQKQANTMKAIINYKDHIIHDAEIKTISDHIVSFYLTKNVRNGELIAYIVERIINESGSISVVDDNTYHIVLDKNEVNEIIVTEL